MREERAAAAARQSQGQSSTSSAYQQPPPPQQQVAPPPPQGFRPPPGTSTPPAKARLRFCVVCASNQNRYEAALEQPMTRARGSPPIAHRSMEGHNVLSCAWISTLEEEAS